MVREGATFSSFSERSATSTNLYLGATVHPVNSWAMNIRELFKTSVVTEKGENMSTNRSFNRSLGVLWIVGAVSWHRHTVLTSCWKTLHSLGFKSWYPLSNIHEKLLRLGMSLSVRALNIKILVNFAEITR
jgi:hypothetical protein